MRWSQRSRSSKALAVTGMGLLAATVAGLGLASMATFDRATRTPDSDDASDSEVGLYDEYEGITFAAIGDEIPTMARLEFDDSGSLLISVYPFINLGDLEEPSGAATMYVIVPGWMHPSDAGGEGVTVETLRWPEGECDGTSTGGTYGPACTTEDLLVAIPYGDVEEGGLASMQLNAKGMKSSGGGTTMLATPWAACTDFASYLDEALDIDTDVLAARCPKTMLTSGMFATRSRERLLNVVDLTGSDDIEIGDDSVQFFSDISLRDNLVWAESPRFRLRYDTDSARREANQWTLASGAVLGVFASTAVTLLWSIGRWLIQRERRDSPKVIAAAATPAVTVPRWMWIPVFGLLLVRSRDRSSGAR